MTILGANATIGRMLWFMNDTAYSEQNTLTTIIISRMILPLSIEIPFHEVSLMVQR